jgi:hypothetical protein
MSWHSPNAMRSGNGLTIHHRQTRPTLDDEDLELSDLYVAQVRLPSCDICNVAIRRCVREFFWN